MRHYSHQQAGRRRVPWSSPFPLMRDAATAGGFEPQIFFSPIVARSANVPNALSAAIMISTVVAKGRCLRSRRRIEMQSRRTGPR